MKAPVLDFDIRPYEDRDEAAVVEMLGTAMGGGPAGVRPVEFFRWKHVDNPFGRSFMLVAEREGEIVGLRAFMRWEWVAGGTTFRAVRAVDTATHPGYRRLGVFAHITNAALEGLAAQADFIFNTPNEKSLPGYLSLGWRRVARVPVHIGLARPLRFAARGAGLARAGAPAPDAPTAREALDALGPALDALCARPDDGRLRTRLEPAFLRWRYADAPLLDYRAVRSEAGLAIFRVRPRGRWVEATVADVLAPDAREAARLLRAVRRRSGADHLTAHFARGTVGVAAARRAGFVRAPRGVTFVARPLREGIEPDPCAFASWSLVAGDLEVF